MDGRFAAILTAAKDVIDVGSSLLVLRDALDIVGAPSAAARLDEAAQSLERSVQAIVEACRAEAA